MGFRIQIERDRRIQWSTIVGPDFHLDFRSIARAMCWATRKKQTDKMANANASKGQPIPTVDPTLSPFVMSTRQSEKSAKKPAHIARTAPVTQNTVLILNVFMRMRTSSNVRGEWHRANTARYANRAPSRRPLYCAR